MERIAGIDTCLTSTGVGIITRRAAGTCLATATTITSRGKRADGLRERHERLTTLAIEIDHAIGTVVLAVLEAPIPVTKGGSPADRYHLWWSVAGRLLDRGVPVAGVRADEPGQVRNGVRRQRQGGRVVCGWPELNPEAAA